MAGQKPELKIAIKDVDGGDRTYLLAFWRRDNGKLSGSLDSKVKGIVVVLEDGTKINVYRKDGKHTHWIDAFEEGSGGARAERHDPQPSAEPADEWDDADCPF